jgi:hypothetical protein
VEEKLQILRSAVEGRMSVKKAFTMVVPTFCDPEKLNVRAEDSEEMKMAATSV